MDAIAPCVFDVFIAPLLDAQSFTELALSAHHTASCVHGSYNYETTRVFKYHRYNHPANVLVHTDTTGAIRRTFGVKWNVTSEKTVLANRLRFMQNVCKLDLLYTLVEDISALATCVNLTLLNISNTRVADISALATCVKLTILVLSYTRVADISPLASCTKLECLYLYNTPITDVTPLAHLVRSGLHIFM